LLGGRCTRSAGQGSGRDRWRRGLGIIIIWSHDLQPHDHEYRYTSTGTCHGLVLLALLSPPEATGAPSLSSLRPSSPPSAWAAGRSLAVARGGGLLLPTRMEAGSWPSDSGGGAPREPAARLTAGWWWRGGVVVMRQGGVVLRGYSGRALMAQIWALRAPSGFGWVLRVVDGTRIFLVRGE
jgi:hypothetical protein